jgi:hypothetical protein
MDSLFFARVLMFGLPAMALLLLGLHIPRPLRRAR